MESNDKDANDAKNAPCFPCISLHVGYLEVTMRSRQPRWSKVSRVFRLTVKLAQATGGVKLGRRYSQPIIFNTAAAPYVVYGYVYSRGTRIERVFEQAANNAVESGNGG